MGAVFVQTAGREPLKPDLAKVRRVSKETRGRVGLTHVIMPLNP